MMMNKKMRICKRSNKKEGAGWKMKKSRRKMMRKIHMMSRNNYDEGEHVFK